MGEPSRNNNTVRHVLVTGGCTGIGLEISRAFADDGCRVMLTSIDEADVHRDEIASVPRFDARLLDVREPQAIDKLVDSLSSLDVLVNCAGTIVRGGREHDPQVFASVLEVNLTGAMRMCQACYPLLKRSQGCVLNIASMLSFFGSGRVPGYSASKGGIVQLTKSLAIAWGADGVRVNAIAPGWIVTNLTEPLAESEDFHESIVARTPLGRWGKPVDVAPAARFLCSPAAAFITGAVLTVDGGYSVA